MKDGMQGISHDRLLMRVKDYIQILTTIGAILWGGIQIVRKLDELEMTLRQIPLLQQQVSRLQQMVVTVRQGQRRQRSEDDE